MLTCGGLPDAVTDAHNAAWSTLYNFITSRLSPAWEHWLDKPVHTTSIPCDYLSELKPDGILLHEEQKRIVVLEFKRTSDFWLDSFARGFLQKWIKYTPLVDSLRSSNPGWSVDLAVFVLGDRGLLDEDQWKSSWETIGLPPKLLGPFCIKAVLAAQTAATSTLAVYNTALKKLNASPMANTPL